MRLTSAFRLCCLTVRSRITARKVRRAGLPGIEFYHFGRRIGWRLLAAGSKAGLDYLIAPVKNIRYFELPFALQNLPADSGNWLDVSSPSLFSLYVAKGNPHSRVRVMNPDLNDVQLTLHVASNLGLTNVSGARAGVDSLARGKDSFDCIWSISVVEHIAGPYDDTSAIQWMFDALKPGGRLIITVPVDRQSWDEYRDVDYYGTQPYVPGKGFFFQRFYDERTLYQRLIRPLGVEPSRLAWFGEKQPGHFANYVRRWLEDGNGFCVDDPLVMLAHYQLYASWKEMPGFGVCGFVVQKPL